MEFILFVAGLLFGIAWAVAYGVSSELLGERAVDIAILLVSVSWAVFVVFTYTESGSVPVEPRWGLYLGVFFGVIAGEYPKEMAVDRINSRGAAVPE